MNPRLRAALFLAALAALVSFTDAAPKPKDAAKTTDWPQWRGPDRTGVSTETGLLKEWPKEGPKLVLTIKELGGGYATPSVANGKIYLMASSGSGNKGDAEVVMVLNASDGSKVWSMELGTSTGGHPGPRCTPTVDGDHVYVLSSDGKLACLTEAKGDIVWQKDLKKDYKGSPGGWAYTESPLVDGDRVVCTPGGNTAPLLCLNKKTGDEIWKASFSDFGKADGGKGKQKAKGKAKPRKPSTQAGYSSVIVATVGGVKQYVQFMAGGVVGVDAKDGKLLWTYTKPASRTANCSTPIFSDNAVFAAAAYSTGGGRADIVKTDGKFEAKPKYFLTNLLNHHGGMVLVKGHVYGTGSSTLMCVDYKTGKEKWSKRGAGKGSVTYADGHIYQHGEGGDVALIEANPDEFKQKGLFKHARSGKPAWAHPVVSGGKLYIRDWDKLYVYDIKAK